MINSQLAVRVKEYRTRKGMSQEVLAEKSGISHRTVQRIENGESNPTGDTLIRLSTALGVNPDDLIDWTLLEDRKYLIFLNLSAMSFIFFPILGILVPFIMWTSKKDKLRNINKVGVELINFELTWTIMLVIVPLALFLLASVGLIETFSLRTILLSTTIMYVLNSITILLNTFRISNNKEVSYFSSIKFLKQ